MSAALVHARLWAIEAAHTLTVFTATFTATVTVGRYLLGIGV